MENKLKTYFISFEFWGDGYSKFFSCTFEIDLSEENIIEKCRGLIFQKFGDIYSEANIKILAFNNIE